jgi:hypothetical protein
MGGVSSIEPPSVQTRYPGMFWLDGRMGRWHNPPDIVQTPVSLWPTGSNHLTEDFPHEKLVSTFTPRLYLFDPSLWTSRVEQRSSRSIHT